MSHKYANDFYIDKDRVVRWNSNNNVPFDDMLMEFLLEGLISTQEFTNSKTQRGIDDSAFFQSYRKENNFPPNSEQLYEMRAAFGEGEVVVDVISGRRIQL